MGVSNSNYEKSLETCCLKNRQKLLHSRKAANDKMSPQKPNPTHRIRAFKLKKKLHFFSFLKNIKDIITGPKSRLFRNHGHRVLCNRTLQKLEVALFRKHEISTKNYIAKTLIHPLATTRAPGCTFHLVAAGNVARDPWFQPPHRARSRGRRA